MEFENQYIEYQEFLKTELSYIDSNFRKLRLIKQNATDIIEKHKYELRQKYDPITFAQDKSKQKKSSHNGFSVKKLQEAMIVMDLYITMATYNIENLLLELRLHQRDSYSELWRKISEFQLPDDISLIQNQFDIIYNDLVLLKNDIQKNLKRIETTELVQNLLNYKMYEIQYNFTTRMDQIQDKREKIEKSKGNASQIALAIVDLEKEVDECQNVHDASFQVAKEQKLEAQKAYENMLGFMDDTLEVFKRHYSNLVLLLDAEKSLVQAPDQHVMAVEELKQDLEVYTQKQAEGWKTKIVKDVSEMPKGVKLTQVGLLLSESGKHITYKEVQAKQLLDHIEHYERVEDTKIVFDKEEQKSPGSLQDKISSEDVTYLKKNLGVPLTLALAEITSVQPRDPIHYLGHWLFKFRYNQEMSDIKRIELENLLDQRKEIAAKQWRSFVENEARAAVIDMIFRAEEEAIRKEFIRIQNESQEEEHENDDLEYEARDTFETYN